MKNMMWCLLKSLCVTLLILKLAPAHADSDVKFHGTLVVVTCQVNQDKLVNVSFGEVGVKKIDGINYSASIPFVVTCNNLSGQGNPGLTLSVNGTAADFNENAISTTVSGLGIQIMKDGVPLKLNTETEISYVPQPTLTAVPVKADGVELSAGDFHATATLVVHVA
ncbi:fimbrial protein [Hafnia paralvei]|jgi:type 1 fimbria pilin|uniref:fimbrial protein n=1 Tax=Hafnia paralvei TaxID=546367 RepID=UPI00158568AB|nr:fimbrial protein [Hafnia paralvei]MCE9882486.1 fimbrial protein [Hafnia paralvei]MCE9909355.1 fimbrial protein [Hafnia paralvei]MCE9912044.1 fimbrial protein [Hafnia paralvei]NUN41635.1 fimbrial protein [Hafnia paralvei]